MVADFAHHYGGLRLADVLLEWSPREVLALVEGLPDDGLFAAHRQGGDDRWREFIGWGKDRHMVADQWDLTLAHAMAGAKEKPTPYPRPNVKKQPAQGVPFLQAIGRLSKGE